MREPVVEVFAEGEPPRELAVGPEGLRIGRLRENEIVLGSRAVSRRHAALRCEGDRILLEDAGSENGCYVNGARVERPVALQPGDELRIGPHRLVLRDGFRRPPAREEEGELDDFPALAGPARSRDRRAEEEPTLQPLGRSAAPAPGDATESAAPEGSQEGALPQEGALRLGGPLEEEGLALDPEDFDVTPEEAAGSGLDGPAPAEAADAAPAALEPPPEASSEAEPGEVPLGAAQAGPDGLYAGFVLQCEGRLDGVVPWEGERLAAGRGSDCEIVLDHPEVSRRHALFVREGEGYEVRDQGSANGTRVNGERVERRRLEVGDVVEIDRFALTFLLDAQPLSTEVLAAAPPSAGGSAEGLAGAPDETRLAGGASAAGLSAAAPGPSEAPWWEASAPSSEAPESLRPSPEPPEPCVAATPAEDDDEKELEGVAPEVAGALPELSPEAEHAAAESAGGAGAGAAAAAPLRLELTLDADALPEPLREALRRLGDVPLRLPVELRLRAPAEGEGGTES